MSLPIIHHALLTIRQVTATYKNSTSVCCIAGITAYCKEYSSQALAAGIFAWKFDQNIQFLLSEVSVDGSDWVQVIKTAKLSHFKDTIPRWWEHSGPLKSVEMVKPEWNTKWFWRSKGETILILSVNRGSRAFLPNKSDSGKFYVDWSINLTLVPKL